MRLLLTFLLACVTLVGCTKQMPHGADASAVLPQLFAKSEVGFADAELRACDIQRTSDGGLTIVAAALDGHEEVAIRMTLLPDWRASTPQGFPGPLFGGKVLIEGVGPRTEAFVRAMGRAYRRSARSYEGTFVSLAGISLEGDPNKLQSEPVKLKVFYESAKESEYAEAYLNFDLPRGVVQFHEKDPGYRDAVLRFLTRKNG